MTSCHILLAISYILYCPYYLFTILHIYHITYLPYYLFTILPICHITYLPYYLFTIFYIYFHIILTSCRRFAASSHIWVIFVYICFMIPTTTLLPDLIFDTPTLFTDLTVRQVHGMLNRPSERWNIDQAERRANIWTRVLYVGDQPRYQSGHRNLP